jgi:hypothetical protein
MALEQKRPDDDHHLLLARGGGGGGGEEGGGGDTLLRKKLVVHGTRVEINVYALGTSRLAEYARSQHTESHVFPRGSIVRVKASLGYRPRILAFYSLVAQVPALQRLLTPADAARIKGLALAALCYMIRTNAKRTRSTVITLEASGSIPGRSMLGLITYYGTLGFVPSNQTASLEDQLGSQCVPMRASLREVLDKCTPMSLSYQRLVSIPNLHAAAPY